jgi:hypothetical protein
MCAVVTVIFGLPIQTFFIVTKSRDSILSFWFVTPCELVDGCRWIPVLRRYILPPSSDTYYRMSLSRNPVTTP